MNIPKDAGKEEDEASRKGPDANDERMQCFQPPASAAGFSGLRRCRALYDCEADNEDELSFHEGDVIVVTNEHTDDDNWMEGFLERAPERRGMIPISFVHMLQD